MQCKDIPTLPILLLLAENPKQPHCRWGTEGHPPSVVTAFPAECPERLLLAKMRNLILKGLVSGCYCGCRGDFLITAAGITATQAAPSPAAQEAAA